ncbi:hypothetical protein [Halarchaeum grantii]|uniref:hypothetical protein n=1 Tax=Halarchaeum grantii TaxID=1193105 RepID=UPI001665AE4A|nr:hypothetical protein [Halarchaeum grantii]
MTRRSSTTTDCSIVSSSSSREFVSVGDDERATFSTAGDGVDGALVVDVSVPGLNPKTGIK